MKVLKNILLTISALLISLAAFAQGNIAEIYTYPAAFKADEEVTIYFDVTGTSLAGNAGPLYLWTWMPSEPKLGNGAWDNSADHMMLTQVEGNMWKFTMTPTEFYGKTAAEITKIAGLLKTKDGSAKTDDFKEENGNAIVLYDFSKMDSQIIDYVPQEFKSDRPLSIILNAANAWSENGTEQGQLVGEPVVSIHSGINGWQSVVESSSPKAVLTKLSDKIYRMDLIPSEYYNTTSPVKEINFLFNKGGDWALSGRDEGGENFTIVPRKPGAGQELEVSTFPTKFTVNDVVTIIFNQKISKNERLQTEGEIYYQLTANIDGQKVEGKAKSLGNGKYGVTLIPARVFADPQTITRLDAQFKSFDGEATSETLKMDSKILIQ